MIRSHIRDYKDEAGQLLDRLEGSFRKAELHQQADMLRKDVQPLLDKHSPSILFYGVYNAGKSSLMNALFGEYISEVGDVPTTVKVHTFTWKGFTLTDTPGINAYADHDAISQTELLKHDVVLFVVEDGGTFDSHIVAREIVRVIRDGKPLLVVVNEKEPEGGDLDNLSQESERLIEIKNKLIDNIRREAESQGIKEVEKKFEILTVNALTAFTAKEEAARVSSGQPGASEADLKLLYSTSRMEELEVALERILEQMKGVRQLTVPVDAMLRFAVNVQEELQKRCATSKEKEYLVKLQSIQENKNTLFRNIVERGRNEIMQAGDTIFSLIVQGKNADETASQLNERLRTIISEEFARANVLLETKLDVGIIRIDPVQTRMADPIELTNASRDVGGEKEWWESLLDIALPQLPLPGLGKGPLPELPRIPGVPGDPRVWIVVEIVKGLIGLVKQKNELEAENQRLKELITEQNAKVQGAINRQITDMMSANNKIRTEMYRLEEEFTSRIRDMIEQGYAKLAESIEELYREEQNTIGKLKEQLVELEAIVEELERFRVRLQ